MRKTVSKWMDGAEMDVRVLSVHPCFHSGPLLLGCSHSIVSPVYLSLQLPQKKSGLLKSLVGLVVIDALMHYLMLIRLWNLFFECEAMHQSVYLVVWLSPPLVSSLEQCTLKAVDTILLPWPPSLRTNLLLQKQLKINKNEIK